MSAPTRRRTPDSRQLAALTAHRGLATWAERLVPLADFRAAAAAPGDRLHPAAREAARRRCRLPVPDATAVEGPFGKVAVFGGVYSNHLALAALLEDAARRRVDAIYCLGDLGGFGPEPEKVWPLLLAGGVRSIQGNYEQSLAAGREDCNCGYTDPRDNHFAAISYDYTARHCSPAFKRWMGELPARRRVLVGGRELLLVHGSPRQVNEFLFASTCPDAFLELLADRHRCDALLCTHTGLPWHRRLPSGRDAVNVGAIGRPANDGRAEVWYALLEARPAGSGGGPPGGLGVELVPLRYDHQAMAAGVRAAGLPEEFAATLLTGWWTTCLEILPARERAASRF
ncbi:MAG TPA: metallophosphoesterase family protein [Thermoanaerobaculia bacterium]|nr:metallophosphoesterase family protein [Thermoanaerobaculia bacterium]